MIKYIFAKNKLSNINTYTYTLSHLFMICFTLISLKVIVPTNDLMVRKIILSFLDKFSKEIC